MLIETMTPEEVSKEILADYKSHFTPDLIKKLGDKYDKLRRKFKVRKSSVYPVWSKVKSEKNNEWLVLISKASSEAEYKSLDSANIFYLVYYYTNIGIRAFKIIPDERGRANGLSVFNSHLFKRYRERMNLDMLPEETIKHFFTNNGYFILNIKEVGDRSLIFATCKDGILLGEVQNEGRWMVHKTFVNDSQMFPEQNHEEEELLKSLKEEVKLQLLNIRQESKEKYQYNADIIAGITGEIDR